MNPWEVVAFVCAVAALIATPFLVVYLIMRCKEKCERGRLTVRPPQAQAAKVEMTE
mgnify:CR=1 FL=1